MAQIFSSGTTKFLAALSKNNRREWFQPRKEEFEELVHVPLLEFAGAINAMFLKEAPAYAFPNPVKAVNRIYRDTRFSKDKTPYQTHVSALFPHQRLGKKTGAAFYFSLSAKEVTIGAGLYFGDTSDLQAVREHLAAEHPRFNAILKRKAVRDVYGELQGESLVKTPKQFGASHPAAELVRRKQWLMIQRQPAEVVVAEDFALRTIKNLKLLIDFADFMNAPLVERVASVDKAKEDPWT